MARSINSSISFVVIIGAVLSYKIVTRSDGMADSVNATVDNIAQNEAVIAEQEAEMTAFESRDDWVLGRWERDYDPSIDAPDWLVFEKGTVTLSSFDGPDKTKQYDVIGTKVLLRIKGSNLIANSDSSELSNAKVTYRKSGY